MSLDAQDRFFLDQLHQLGEATIQQMCEMMGVTPTAIRVRLNRLEGKGYIDKATIREGRGRPHHVYSVSTEALRELGDNYSGLALILWNEIANMEDSEVKTALIERVKDALVKRYKSGVSGRTVMERFVELRNALTNHGFHVSVDYRGDLPVLQEKHCPYHDLAEHQMSICDLEKSVFEEVLGAPIRRTRCSRDGDHSCEFEPMLQS